MTKPVQKRQRVSKRHFVAGSMLLATMLPHSASADRMVCNTKVQNVAVDPAGDLYVGFVNLGRWRMCNVSADFSTSVGVIKPATCQAMMAKFLTAQTTKGNVQVHANFGSNPAPQCSFGVLGDWVVPSPYPFLIDFLSD